MIFFDIYEQSKDFAEDFYKKINSLLFKSKINLNDYNKLFESDENKECLEKIFVIKLNFPKKIF